ncbi:MAG: pantetheine-phosphate adenylyltransferase [Bacteroidetes bacterium]|nr:MAG: pantetheine-phosphate adenylyltransferase [Bacteroidota bacterium]
MNSKTAIFPGSFDPITRGHETIVKKALPLFDKIIIGVGQNTSKKYYFDIEQRIKYIEQTFEQEPKIEIKSYNELTVDFCKKHNAKFILRGLRTAADFEFEKSIAHLNHHLNNEIETLFFLTPPDISYISSSLVREILNFGGDVSKLIPENVTL